MEFYKKYRHVGYSYPGVPNGWKTIIEQAIIDIEKVMWPRWMPMFLKRWIHYLATDNSVVRVKYHWAYNLRRKLTGGQMITDIKDKYAGLRMYAYAGEKIDNIIDKATEECSKTCENCGSKEDVKVVGDGWVENLCDKCSGESKKFHREILTEKIL